MSSLMIFLYMSFTFSSKVLILYVISYFLIPEFVGAYDYKCRYGSFCYDEGFEGICESEFYLCDHPELFAFELSYCVVGGALPPEIGDQMCMCDCDYAHHATKDSERCVSENNKTTPCRCEYNENPCKNESNWEYVDPSVIPEVPVDLLRTDEVQLANQTAAGNKTGLPVWEIVNGLVSVVVGDECKDVMEGAVSAVCEADPVNFGTNVLYGLDFCAIDCKCTHRSTKPPYGFCKKVEANPSPISICFCLT